MSSKQALVVGINDYANAPSLRYATKDASAIADLLEMPEYGFDVTLMLDDSATAVDTQAGIETLLDSTSEIKLIFFAGHGQSDDESVYLATTDNSPALPGINLDWLTGC